MVTRPIIPIPVCLPLLLLVFGAFLYLSLKKPVKVQEKILRILRVALILVLIFTVNLRPQTKRYDMNVETKNIDVLFVCDTTISMWAYDYDGSYERMTGVRKTAEHMMDELYGSAFGLIRFDNRSQILAPFTQDARSVRDAFSTLLAPDRWYARGSRLGTAYDDMESLLISSAGKDGKTTILIFMSDGEITDGSELPDFSALEKYVDGGAVLGFGTAAGGMMRDTYGTRIYDNETGQEAVSHIDEANLQAIADSLGIEYIHVEQPESIDGLIRSIKTMSTTGIGTQNAVLYDDTYYIYAAPLALLLLVEAFLVIRRRRL